MAQIKTKRPAVSCLLSVDLWEASFSVTEGFFPIQHERSYYGRVGMQQLKEKFNLFFPPCNFLSTSMPTNFLM